MPKKPVGLVLCAFLASAGIAMFGQGPGPKLQFEVASIKPAPPLTPALIQSGKMRIGMKIDAGRVDIGGMPILALLPQVFHVKQYQVLGAGTPANGLNGDRWDIQAKLPEGTTQDQVPDMLLALLEDRFKLTYHRDKKELQVYGLIVGKGGSKLKDLSSEPDAPVPDDPASTVLNTGNGQVRINQQSAPGGRGGSATISSPQFGSMKMAMGQDGAMHLEAAKITMAGLAELLTSFVDRPVVDMTEMKGSYQVTLDLSIEDILSVARAQGALGAGLVGPGGGAGGGLTSATASDPSGGAVFAAVQKLGLKLDSRKALVETIVVDHIEKSPTEN